jgi:hypothetical protein
MPPPSLEQGNDAPPRQDQILHGELEVFISQAMGRKRCKRIRVGLRGVVMLNLEADKWEDDVVFETETELFTGGDKAEDSSSSQGIWLDVGTQR